jgi:eukaryotic-like serine/threonine-protein kinase
VDGKLKKVATDGGPIQVICDAPDARGGSWGRSGMIIFAATRISPILRVSAEGGAPMAIAQGVRGSEQLGTVSKRWPQFLPDGEHFVYVNAPNGVCTELSELRYASIDGKQDISLMRTCSNAAFANGHLLYWRDGNLLAQPFDPRNGALSGVPSAITKHVDFESLFSIAEFSVSAEGKLVYSAGDPALNNQLLWYDRNGKVLGTLGQNDHYKTVGISPDGLRVVADTTGGKESTIRILDARGARTLTTLPNGDGGSPTWAPDGRHIYFTSSANGPQDIYVRAADGSGEETEVLGFDKNLFGATLLAVSPDGNFLAYAFVDPTTNLDIYTVALTDGNRKPQAFLHSGASESAPAFSPDGKWLAYESNVSGTNEVYVTPFPSAGAQYQVSTNGGQRPVWRHDGKEIYYREGARIMAVEAKSNAGSLELSAPTALFELGTPNFSGHYYDVARDGRFLVNTFPPKAKAQSFSLMVNWPARLKR